MTVLRWLQIYTNREHAVFKIQDEKSFWGSGHELAEKATHCAKAFGIKSEKINPRLIRYYVAENIINKPDRLGKEAAYNYLHLLQLMVARKTAQAGAPLSTIKVFNQGASVGELERALVGELDKEAQQMIKKISADQQYAEENYNKSQRASEFREYLKVIKNLESAWTENVEQRKQKNAYEFERISNSRVITQNIAIKAERYLQESIEKLEIINKRVLEIDECTKYHTKSISELLEEFINKSDSIQREQQINMRLILKEIDIRLNRLEDILDNLKG
jgi:hypothetical protein